MTTTDRLEKYAAMMKELKALGTEILENCTEGDYDIYANQIDEIDNMDMHFDCSISILEKEVDE